MKTTITEKKDKTSRLPEVGEPFRMIDSEIFVRIDDEQGRKAIDFKRTDGVFFAVCLVDGQIGIWESDRALADDQFHICAPAGGQAQFEDIT